MNKILKVGTGLASAVAALAMAFPVYALITNVDVAANAGIQYSKLSLGGKVTSANIKDGTITGKDIKGSTIKSGDIKDGTITVDDLAAGTLTATALADGSVTSAKILDATIANADVSATAAIAYSKLNLTGLVVSGDITNGTIAGADLATNIAISTTGSVATTGSGTITSAGLLTASNGLTLSSGTLTLPATSVANAALQSSVSLLGQTIESADIFDGTITGGTAGSGVDIAANTITAANIATDAIGADELGDSSVDTLAIINGTIAAVDIAAGAVTASKLQSAAADLGAADVTVNLGNTNGAFNTNVTTDGTMTAAGVYSSSAIFDGVSTLTTLHLGETFALGVALGSSTINTQVAGDLTVTGGEVTFTGLAADPAAVEGKVYYNSTDKNLYVYDGTAFRDLTAGAAGGTTLDEAYNTSAGASTVIVDNGDLTLRSNAGATGDIIVDLNSTGDFILQDAGTDVVTFSDTGNLTMASGTLALNGDVVTSDGGLALTGASGLTAIATTGDASLIASAAGVVIRGVQAAANAIFLDANNDVAGGIDMDAGTGGITVDTTGVLSLDAAGATNVTTTVGNLSLISSAGSAILTGAEAVASAIDINATAGGADIDVVTQFTVDVSAATGASNISVVANADAEDLTIATTGTEGDVIINTADDFALGVAAGAVVDIADSAVAKTIDIGGVTASGTDTISIATEGTAADVIAVGNANAATTLALTGGTAWSVTTAGLITTTGDLVVNGDNIDADGTLVIAGGAGLTLGATLGNATLTGATDASVTGTAGDVTLTSGDDLLLNPTDDITATLAAAGSVTVNATTTANTTTTGVIAMNVGAGDAAVDGLNISLTQNDGATAAVDATATEILLTGNDADGDMFGLTITGADTVNAAGGTYEAGIFIDNADTTATSMTDGILITSSGVDGGVVDAVDVSAANITNAINVGANVVLGTTADINLDNFDVTGATGNITTAGDLAVNGDNIDADGALVVTGGTAASLVATTGDANVTSTLGSVVITANEAAADAIVLNAATAVGGIDIISNADIDITTTGTAGEDITITDTGGSVNINSTEDVSDAIVMNASAGGIDILATGADGQDITLTNTGGSLNLNASEAAANAVRVNASNAAGGIDVDAGTAGITVDSTGTISIDAAGAASNLSLASTGDAQDLTVAVTGVSNSSLFLTSTGTGADAVRVQASAGGIDIDADSTVTLNTTNDELQIATGNQDMVLSGSADGTAALTVTAGDVTLTDGDLNVSGGDFNVTLDTADGVTIGSTASTATTGIVDMNVTAGDAAVDGLNIAMTQNDGATAAVDATAAEILLTGDDADGDMFGLTITGAATANAAAGTYEAAISINNAEDAVGSMTDGIVIAATTDTATTDAIDVSDAELVNAINVGANVILGTTANINLDNFDVTGATGNVVTAGDIAVNGDNITSDATLDINGATGMNINTTAGAVVLNPAGSGEVNPGADSTDNLGADATRWSTIFADNLNYSAAITDDNSADTTVSLGDDGTTVGGAGMDTVTITANTSISDEQWSVTAPGVATFAGINGPVGGVTPASIDATTIQLDTTLTFDTNNETIDNVTDGTFTFTRDTDAAVTITSADTTANADLTVTPGGTGDLTLGSGTAGSVTISTNGTGNGELTLPNDSIGDADIDWGTGAGQVSGADITFAEGDMTDSTIVSADIKNGTIAGGDLATDIAITTSGTLTSTGTVDFSGATTKIDVVASLTDGGTCAAAGDVGKIVVGDTAADNDAVLLVCEEGGAGGYSWEVYGAL